MVADPDRRSVAVAGGRRRRSFSLVVDRVGGRNRERWGEGAGGKASEAGVAAARASVCQVEMAERSGDRERMGDPKRQSNVWEEEGVNVEARKVIGKDDHQSTIARGQKPHARTGLGGATLIRVNAKRVAALPSALIPIRDVRQSTRDCASHALDAGWDGRSQSL